MNEWLEKYYGLKAEHINKVSPCVWKITSNGKKYYLKKADPLKLIEALPLVQSMSIPLFAPLVPCQNGELFVSYQEAGYFLCLEIETKENVVPDFKLRYYLNFLARLHQNTFYVARIEDGFYVRLIECYRQRRMQCASWYENWLQSCQLAYYPSPAYWCLQDLYPRICHCLARAECLITRLEELTTQKETRRLCLTYGNYAPEHFSCKTNQLIGLDHCQLDSPIADIYALYRQAHFPFVEWEMIETFYFAHFSWQEYEKLDFAIQLCLMPHFCEDTDDFQQVECIFHLQMYLNQIEIILSALNLENV